MLLEPGKLCQLFMPAAVPGTFEELALPLMISATDFYARSEVVLQSGPLRPAIAASMAIPGLIRPVEIAGRILVDGAAVNPLPFEHLRGRADVVVAVDTSIGPVAPRGIPDPWESLFATIQIMGHAIVDEKLKTGAPAIVIRPNVGAFRLLDLLQASAILRAAEPAKAELKSKLAALLES
jgi:NTE family protein